MPAVRGDEAKVGDAAPEAMLRALVEMSDDAIFACDAAGAVTTWGATAERLFGWPAGDVLEGPLDALFPEHLRPEVRSVVATVIAGDRITHFETEVLRPDGMPVPVSLSLRPVFDVDQAGDVGDVPFGSVVIARDVTEQRLAQAALAEVEARLEMSEALAHAGSWLWDVRTGAVQWSAEFHRIHGVDPLDFDGTFESHIGLVHPGDREDVRAAMEASVASGRPLEREYRVVRPDRTQRVLRVTAQPAVGSAGRVVGLRGVGQDVTDDAAVTPDPRDA